MPETKFETKKFLHEFKGALDLLEEAELAGVEAAQNGYERLIFVGCGAPHQMMKSINYWTDRYSRKTDVRIYHAGEFVHQAPAALDENTIVFLGSHSGTTPEVIDAAEYLRSKPCQTLAFTQESDSPLGGCVQQVFAYGKSNQGYFSSLMIALAFTSGFIKEREESWDFHLDLMKSLQNLPDALAEAKTGSISKGKKIAEKLKDSEYIYFIGSGPMFTTAYIYAACFLMEMQWMHAFPLSAAEFFHGPFEVFDEETPLVLLMGEDPSRTEAERVLAFCHKYLSDPIIYDSRDFNMPGISESVRGMLAPFILDAAMTNLVESLAEMRGHPLTMRRYMGRVEY